MPHAGSDIQVRTMNLQPAWREAAAAFSAFASIAHFIGEDPLLFHMAMYRLKLVLNGAPHGADGHNITQTNISDKKRQHPEKPKEGQPRICRIRGSIPSGVFFRNNRIC